MSITPFPETVAAIAAAAELFLDGEHPIEVRAPKAKRYGTLSGYFDDAATLAKAVRSYDGKVPSLYVTLNPCSRDALARASNRLVERADVTTKDSEIVRRRWLLVDFDPVRLTGTSSTNDEHGLAHARAAAVADMLTYEMDWPAPVRADSGNGAHLLYRIDMPNDAEATSLIQRVLQALAERWSDSAVVVDRSVHNAARITKLYGTKTCKGDDTDDRPHRRSRLLDVPAELVVVTTEQLLALVPPVPAAPAKTPRPSAATAAPTGRSYDVEAFIGRHGFSVSKEGPWEGGYRWELEVCPWDDSHTDKPAFIARHPSGAISAGCHHDTCKGRDWKTLRAKFDPKIERQTEPPEDLDIMEFEDDRPSNPAKAAPGLPVSTNEIQKNYVVIAGTESILCRRTGELMKAGAVRLLHGSKRFKAWSEDPRREVCDLDRLVFKPGGAAEDEFNLFAGLPRLEVRSNDADTWLAHVSRACEADEVSFDWVIKRLAYKVQNPGHKVGTSIVIHGKPGSGKNLLFAPLMKIFGKYAREVGQIQVDSPYTGWLSRALFLLCDEVEIASKRTQNKLKALITSPRVAIEEKYQPVRFEDNFADLHFLSNDLAPVTLEADDRRYMVLRLDEIRDPAYYAALAAIDPGSVCEHLLGVDVGGWNPNEAPPHTARKNDLVGLTKPSVERFLDEWRAGDLPVPAGAALAADLYTAYTVWSKTHAEAAMSQRRFGATAAAVMGGSKPMRLGERVAKAYAEPTADAAEAATRFAAALNGWIKNEQARKL